MVLTNYSAIVLVVHCQRSPFLWLSTCYMVYSMGGQPVARVPQVAQAASGCGMQQIKEGTGSTDARSRKQNSRSGRRKGSEPRLVVRGLIFDTPATKVGPHWYRVSYCFQFCTL